MLKALAQHVPITSDSEGMFEAIMRCSSELCGDRRTMTRICVSSIYICSSVGGGEACSSGKCLAKKNPHVFQGREYEEGNSKVKTSGLPFPAVPHLKMSRQTDGGALSALTVSQRAGGRAGARTPGQALACVVCCALV